MPMRVRESSPFDPAIFQFVLENLGKSVVLGSANDCCIDLRLEQIIISLSCSFSFIGGSLQVGNNLIHVIHTREIRDDGHRLWLHNIIENVVCIIVQAVAMILEDQLAQKPVHTLFKPLVLLEKKCLLLLISHSGIGRELDFISSSFLKQHFIKRVTLLQLCDVGFSRRPTLQLEDLFNCSTKHVAGKGRLHLWAQQALKDAKMLEAILRTLDPLLRKHELVQKIMGAHILCRLPMQALKHLHLDLGQVGALISQGRIDPNLERNLGRSGVIVLR
jgi:hypothetical protein